MRQIRVALAWAAFVLSAFFMCRVASADTTDAYSGAWTIHCTPTTSTATLGVDPFDDAFLFESGQFSAQAYAGLGFTPDAYTITSTGRFTATLSSSDRGSVVWKGMASGNTMYGYITWTKPDGTIYHYHFTGTLTPPPAADQSQGSSDLTGD